jgi:hypothetical protein
MPTTVISALFKKNPEVGSGLKTVDIHVIYELKALPWPPMKLLFLIYQFYAFYTMTLKTILLLVEYFTLVSLLPHLTANILNASFT